MTTVYKFTECDVREQLKVAVESVADIVSYTIEYDCFVFLVATDNRQLVSCL